jgi:apolipoprotein N-acyltransferase
VPAVFPWKLGYAQVAWPVVVQSVDLFGPEFATFTFFAHAGTVAWVIHAAARGAEAAWARAWPPAELPRGARLALAVSAMNAIYGVGAMELWGRRIDSAPTFTAALVQANPEDEDGIACLQRLTRERSCPGVAAPDLVCWPECSGGCYEAGLDSLADSARVLACSRPPHRGLRPLENPCCPLLFGGKIYTGHPERPRTLHQSAILVDADETIRGRYHKRHLMPFGEYVPGSGTFPEIAASFPMADEFTAGAEASVLDWGGRPRLGVMLCYEDMIPAAARSLVQRSANVLVSLINGSAFTEPLTLTQHRMLAQLRAVECRRSLLRCAATGETCAISPLGTITAALPAHARGALLVSVPLLDAPTLATRIAPAFPPACGAVAAVLALGRLRTAGPARRFRHDADGKRFA